MAEGQPHHIPDPQRALQEGGNGSPGIPPTVHERSKPPPESQERQPLPNVWDYLERRVRLKDRSRGEEYDRERREVNRLEDEIYANGTPRDGLILDLYDERRYEPGNSQGVSRFRRLSLEEYQQFRSKFELLSEEQLSEELRKQEEEGRKRLPPDLPTVALYNPGIPHDDDIDDE
jgi:hypothetical protein